MHTCLHRCITARAAPSPHRVTDRRPCSCCPHLLPHLRHRLLGAVVDPAAFDFWVQKLNRMWFWSRTLARVVERHVEAQDAVTLILQPNGDWAGFLPGQRMNVGAEVNGRRITPS